MRLDREFTRPLVNARLYQAARPVFFVAASGGLFPARPALGEIYREVMGDHYPAMALVAVTRLVEPDARLEIETTAVVPEH